MKLRARCTVFLLVASLGTIALAGPASAAPTKTVPANKWATSMCTAVSGWLQGLKSGEQAINSKVSDPNLTVPDVTAALDQFLSTGSAATSQTIATLKKAGTPDTKNGAKIANSLTTAFVAIKGQAAAARSQAAALDSSSATYGDDIGKVLDAFATNFGKSLNDWGNRADKLADKSFNKVLKANKTCKALNS
jgi:hypothetical protein